MIAEDHFSRWLGVKVLDLSEGYCRLQASIREEMLNSFGMVHGGVPFSLQTPPSHMPATTGTPAPSRSMPTCRS